MIVFFQRYTGKTINTINLGSYNYLGFAEKTGLCAMNSIHAMKNFGIANCNARIEIGMTMVYIL